MLMCSQDGGLLISTSPPRGGGPPAAWQPLGSQHSSGAQVSEHSQPIAPAKYAGMHLPSSAHTFSATGLPS
eukprot:scaffold44644_cov22-Tisochrysis_lutea.AAC.1